MIAEDVVMDKKRFAFQSSLLYVCGAKYLLRV